MTEEKNAIEILTEWKDYNIKHKNILREADTIINVQETILNLIEKQQKENQELKDKNKTLENLLQGNLYEMYKYYRDLSGKYQGSCIPKQKIKDKIEEKRNKQINEYKSCGYSENYYHIISVISVLQELLEEEEECH